MENMLVKVVADKDATEKTLEGYEDVFADIVNVLLFEGTHHCPGGLAGCPASFHLQGRRKAP